MKTITAALLLATYLLPSSAAQACTFDTDCAIGSQCVKSLDAIHGACVGGLFPGNGNDSNPAFRPADPNSSYGNTCSFDSDCGTGVSCNKDGGVFGTCI